MIRYQQILILVLAILIPQRILAQTLSPEPSPYLKELLAKHRLAAKDISFAFLDLQKKDSMEQFQGDQLYVPASLMKIPTCHFALETLGARHTYKTQLSKRGDHLILKGGGDPFLTATKLFNLALQLKIKGITKIEGQFYYDESFFQPLKQISALGSGDQTYNPSVGPLNAEFNRIRVQKDPARAKTKKADFQSLPQLDFFQLEKTSKAFSGRQNFVYVDQADALKEKWLLSQEIKYKSFEEIPIRNPGLFSASLFHFFAQNLGISLPSPLPLTKNIKDQMAKLDDSTLLIADYQSATVLEICEMSLEYSNNLFAEILLLTAAKKMNPTVVGLEQAAQLMRRWFIQKYPELGFQTAFFENGSGLSLKSRLSSLALAKFLHQTSNLQYQGRTFWSMLSLAGQSGWMRNRLHSSPVAFRVFAKTGSLDFAHNLTGYLTGASGKNYAFAILVSDIEKREQFENEKSPDKRQALSREAGNYRQRANDFADELLEYWSKI